MKQVFKITEHSVGEDFKEPSRWPNQAAGWVLVSAQPVPGEYPKVCATWRAELDES